MKQELRNFVLALFYWFNLVIFQPQLHNGSKNNHCKMKFHMCMELDKLVVKHELSFTMNVICSETESGNQRKIKKN